MRNSYRISVLATFLFLGWISALLYLSQITLGAQLKKKVCIASILITISSKSYFQMTWFFKKKKLMLISCTQPSWITSHICNVPPESNQSVKMWAVQCLNWKEVGPNWGLIWCWREERPTAHRTQNWNIEKPLGPHPGWCLKGLNGGKECSAWASSSGHVPPLATSSSQLLKRSRVDRDQRQLLLWRERAVF